MIELLRARPLGRGTSRLALTLDLLFAEPDLARLSSLWLRRSHVSWFAFRSALSSEVSALIVCLHSH